MEIPRYNGRNIPTWGSRPTCKFIKKHLTTSSVVLKGPASHSKWRVQRIKTKILKEDSGESAIPCVPPSHIRAKEWVHLPLAHAGREELQEGHPEGWACAQHGGGKGGGRRGRGVSDSGWRKGGRMKGLTDWPALLAMVCPRFCSPPCRQIWATGRKWVWSHLDPTQEDHPEGWKDSTTGSYGMDCQKPRGKENALLILQVKCRGPVTRRERHCLLCT